MNRPWPCPEVRHGGRTAFLFLLAGLVSHGQLAASPPPLEVEYAGCRRAFVGPVCELRKNLELTLWVATPTSGEVVIEVDGKAREIAGVEAGFGRRYQVDLATTSRRLVVRAAETAPWTLSLRPPVSLPWLREAANHVNSGDTEKARAVVENATLEGAAEPRRAYSFLGRIAAHAEPSRARALLGRAVKDHHEAGEHLQEAKDTAALFVFHLRRHELVEARQALTALHCDWQEPAEVAYSAAYYAGLLARETGDLRTALRMLEAAFSRAERLDLRVEWLEAGQILASQLRELGRGEEAYALRDRLLDGIPDDYDACIHGELLINAGWISLLALEAGESATDPSHLLRQALSIFEQECRQQPDALVTVRLNLILAQIHGGRLEEARRQLRRVMELQHEPNPRLQLSLVEIEGRLALADGRGGEALHAYDKLVRLAEAGLSPEAQWRAALGRGRALEALSRRTEALKALAEADRLLDAASLTAPLTEGRETFVKQREEGARLHVDLLLAAGHPSEALAVVRRARLRGLRALLREDRLAHLPPEEQDRWDRAVSSFHARRAAIDAEVSGHWRLSQESLRRAQKDISARRRQLLRDLDDAWSHLDQLDPEPDPPSPKAGELLLVYHPLPAGWVGFASDARGLVVRRLDCVPEDLVEDLMPKGGLAKEDHAPKVAASVELGTCLLAPFAEQIARTEQIRVLPYGPLRQVDFHALPFAGDSLLVARPVVYGLDVQRSSARRLSEPSSELAAAARRALVIADPGGDLPAARHEARAVAETLSAMGGWRVQTLRGQEALGRSVRNLLPGVDHFHYAGHAAFAGLGGWRSALRLAGGSQLTVGDVLTLRRAPRSVVLSGCETGRGSRRSAVLSVSLAHAFVVAGSSSVVATTRPVADATALRLIEDFYRAWLGEITPGDITPALALREAQLALRREAPTADWSAFRIVEP